MEDSVQKLAHLFARFPGIGERQARRFVYYLLGQDKQTTDELIKLIGELKRGVSQCPRCFKFFGKKDGTSTCSICGDTSRDNTSLMIVEKDADLENIEKNKSYQGLYFVLGGLVPIVEKDVLHRVRIEELKSRAGEDLKKKNLNEIVLAFSLSPQGEHTDLYIRRILDPILEGSSVKITSLGRGLSTGTELEYSDRDTLMNALKNRN